MAEQANRPAQTGAEGQEALSDALRVSFRVLRGVMILLLAIYLLSGLFVVQQHEKAFVLVFGRVVGSGEGRILGPGFHWTMPRPLAEVVRVPAERVQSVTTDTFWYYVPEEYRLRDQEPRPEKTLDPRHDGYTLSGDANLLHSRWELRYTIADPEAYAFGFSRPEEILRKELDHAVAMTSARYTIDEALRTDIEAFRSDVDHEVRRRIEQLGLGARVQRVDLVTVRPPRQVAEAFDAVVQAEQESSRRNSDARAYASRTLNEARGDAARLVSEGKAYKKRLVNEARANAEYFEAVYEKYVRNPHITARTLLQDTLRRSLANVEEKYVIYRSGADDQEFRLQLSPKAKQRNPSQ